VDAYFSCYNCSYPILHEPSFRRQREQRPGTDPASCWTAIHAMVLAIGQWILDEEPQESLYFALARSWLSARALESGTLGAVQAFLLMVGLRSFL
jgi:transcriptional regulatory protein GAL4